MKPTRRNKRLALLSLGGVALGLAALLTFTALSQNLDYFYTPEDIVAGKAGLTRRIRLGGLVARDSIRNGEGVERIFDVTDGSASVTVIYNGILPDLFREGQGVIAQGRFKEGHTNSEPDQSIVFIADIILAKHDENYKPKELKEALEG